MSIFLVTDAEYAPKIVIEINDQSHLSRDRRERDIKVQNILEEAGIPVMKLWTSYGVNSVYIQEKITEILNAPIVRKHHFIQQKELQPEVISTSQSQLQLNGGEKKKQGCYIASCVYGSYDCPQVWTLRRYRDYELSTHWYGRLFIKIYYAISPTFVKWFGNSPLFCVFWKKKLDKLVVRLRAKGYEDIPYNDLNR